MLLKKSIGKRQKYVDTQYQLIAIPPNSIKRPSSECSKSVELSKRRYNNLNFGRIFILLISFKLLSFNFQNVQGK